MHFFSNSINASFEDTILAAKDVLRRHGFKIVSEIDIQKGFKKHLGANVRPYVILSVYDPVAAYHATRIFDRIGSVILCNVVVQELNDGCVDVSVVDPAAFMLVINHVELDLVVRDLRYNLQRAIEEINVRPAFMRHRQLRESDEVRRKVAHQNP